MENASLLNATYENHGLTIYGIAACANALRRVRTSITTIQNR
ncbi:MAG: hypothetical protein OJF48_004620 [Afipia sp.]|nr:MAG: hypothetical protein OJF48_004620 [Afipia sp.]